ncbi:MAG: zinc ribbon domain-containing protein [Eubacteriales bacterium]
MYCSKCGHQIDENSIFCSKCGNRVTAAASVSQAHTQRTPIMETRIEETGGSTQELIDEMAIFSWSVKSTQKVDVKDSHLETRGDSLYNVTTRDIYYSITFERDTTTPWYKEVKALEEEYNRLRMTPTPDSQCVVEKFSFGEFVKIYFKSMLSPFSSMPALINGLHENSQKRKEQQKFRDENYERLCIEYNEKMRRCEEIKETARNLPAQYMGN